MSGRLSQGEREALAAADARYLALPLQMSADRKLMLAHTRHVARLLKDPQAASPSAQAVAHINALFERSIFEDAKRMTACRQGCAHCCHQPVILYAPELFFLAAHINAQDEMVARLRKDLEPAKRQPMGAPCALLKDEACSVYAARPLSCRAFVSLDVSDCLSSFRYLNERTIRMPQVYNSQRNLCRTILVAAARAAGLPTHVYELNSAALATVLTQDNAEKRWLNGEDVLGELEIVPPAISPEIAADIAQLAAGVAPAL